jgi:hypothetical protein
MWLEVLPLQILGHLVVGVASLDREDDGHGGQPGLNGRSPAPAAKADQVTTTTLAARAGWLRAGFAQKSSFTNAPIR